MEGIICFLASYLVGSINPAYIIGKLKGFDIRERGSGNAGGSNTFIVIGKAAALLVIFFDIFKSYGIITLFHKMLFPKFRYSFPLSATGVILGHIYPVFMKFRGGKGLACMIGSAIALDIKVFLVLLVGELILLFILDYIFAVATTLSIVLPFSYWYVTKDVAGMAIMFIITIPVLTRHIENFKRTRAGKELHFSYIWKKDEELDRINAN